MPGLLSGKTLRSGGSQTFIDLKGAQPQFPPDTDQSTGYTISTNNFSVSTATNTLGNLVHYKGQIYSNLPNGNIVFTGTGTGTVIVSQPTVSLSTDTGALIVRGGIGVGGGMNIQNDIVVNGITVGQGFQGINNISLEGAPAFSPINDFNNGQESISIGWGSLQGISSSNRSIAIGVNALSSGTGLRSNIAIGDSALKSIGVTPQFLLLPVLAVTNATTAVLTVTGHGYTTGTEVIINNAQGMIELNSNKYWVDIVDQDNIKLYSDNILGTAVDSTGYGTYTGSATIHRVLLTDNNIGVGTNAGKSLYDGTKNLFLGDNLAINLTTGTSNFILGHDAANNLIQGNRNISIMGDNLVDGVNDQISIGGVFYYNGNQLLDLNTDVLVGLGTQSTSTNTGSLLVQGGVGITRSLYVGEEFNVSGTGTVTLSPVGVDVNITPSGDGRVNIFPTSTPGNMNNVTIGDVQPRDGTFTNLRAQTTYVLSTSNAVSTSSGALQVAGGASFANDVWIGGILHATLFGATTTATGAINLIGGDRGSIPYQLTTSSTAMLPLGSSGKILLSNGLQPIWGDPGAVSVNTATNAYDVYVVQTNETVSSGTVIPIMLAEAIDDFSPVAVNTQFAWDDNKLGLTTPNIFVTSTSTSSSLITGAVQVAGGIGAKNLYIDGNVQIKGLVSANQVVFSDAQGNLTNQGVLFYNTSTAVLTGNITTATNLFGGLPGDLLYQTDTGITTFLPIGNYAQVLISTGSAPQWTDLASIAATTSTNSDNIYVQTTKEDLAAGGTFYVALDSSYDAYSKISNTSTFTWDDSLNTVGIGSTTSATSTITGALVVAGGVGVKGDVYSKSGHPDENYKLYVPRTTLSVGVAPTNPRLGDFWIDPGIGATFQYILDGTNKIWFQFTGL